MKRFGSGSGYYGSCYSGYYYYYPEYYYYYRPYYYNNPYSRRHRGGIGRIAIDRPFRN